MRATSTLNSRPRAARPVADRKAPEESTSARKVADGTVKRLCRVFKMLSDPSRLKILLALTQNGRMHVSALCDLLKPQSQPAISHHLSLMKDSLVSCDREGKHNFYRLDSAQVGDLVEQLFTSLGSTSRQIQFDEFALAFKRK